MLGRGLRGIPCCRRWLFLFARSTFRTRNGGVYFSCKSGGAPRVSQCGNKVDNHHRGKIILGELSMSGTLAYVRYCEVWLARCNLSFRWQSIGVSQRGSLVLLLISHRAGFGDSPV